MNWYTVFYALTVSEGVKSFFDATSDIFTWLAVLSFIVFCIGFIGKSVTISSNTIETLEDEKVDPDARAFENVKKYSLKFMYLMIALSLITWFGYVATPTKKDCVMIIAGGTIGNFLQSDTNARKIPSELTKLSVVALQTWQDQIKDFSPEEREALGIQTPTEKKKVDLVKKLSDMTKDEIIKFIESDTALLK